MSEKIRVGIVGYGNLGKGVEFALKQNPDFELIAIFTRRTPAPDSGLVSIKSILDYKGKIDLMFMCGGSATDLPVQVPEIAAHFNTIDSFDTHAKIPEYFKSVDAVAKKAGTLSMISSGWDPGLFSLNRVLADAVLPEGHTYTFWGKGISQGHSDAIRRIEGVADAKQYTVPIPAALDSVRRGENKEFTTREKHRRVCYVVAKEGADLAKIEKEIVTMPNYFADYDTEVNFITQEELNRDHAGLPHGGFVIRSGESAAGTKQKVEFSLELGSNPEFTSSVLVACGRAVARMARRGIVGAVTIFDLPVGALSPLSADQLRKEYL
ncbi:MAG: diaminopimelate dehydrogenase [Oscillospiraceae bacterium]|nr:diaminopimelate dehydrogenase [Oscillospiraceae bacterium]